MITGTLSRYFAMRFAGSVVGSLIGVIALAAMIDYVELMRRGADWPNATAWAGFPKRHQIPTSHFETMAFATSSLPAMTASTA